MSIHIVFGKYWERVRAGFLAGLRRPRLAMKALHRVRYLSLVRRRERRIYRGPASLAALSAKEGRELKARYGRPLRSVTVIPHRVDTQKFSPEGRERLRAQIRRELGVERRTVLLLVGNDAHKKGADLAVRALAHLPEEATLALAGRLDAAQVEAWARESGVEGRVLLWAHRPGVEAYYAAADVLLAPSREDAFSLPPLEAMACGLPVVVSARAGVSELVEDGTHALVVQDPENAEALAAALKRVLAEPGLAERLAQEGRRLAESLSWDDNAERTAALIEREATTPRVLVLAPDPAGTGGIERVTRTLLRVCAESYGSERVGLVAVWAREGLAALPCRILFEGRSAPGAGPARVPLSARLRFGLAALGAARRWRRRLVVVAVHPHLAPVARACGAISGAPYAVWCHGFETWGRLRPSVRSALRQAGAVFAPSVFSARATEAAAGLPAGSLRVIPHCLPPELEGTEGPLEAPFDEHLRVLTVARLDPRNAYKGVDTLLLAWPLVRARAPGAELLVVGDGPDRPRLEALARALCASGVRFLGRVGDAEVARLYREASVFALPARAKTGRRPEGEGFGLVFVEAQAAGLPVVAGKAGPAPEVVADGETGLLVDPEDPAAVADALVRLLACPEEAARMGEAGRKRAAEQFGYPRFREAVDELIRSLARGLACGGERR